jgi:mannose-6-phosphate isomerase-like protein (cupin superfamily)
MTMEVERPAGAGAPSPVGPSAAEAQRRSPFAGRCRRSRRVAPTEAPGRAHAVEDRLVAVDPIRVREVQGRLEQGQGGYEIVHESEGLELGVYVLVAPEPDSQQPHDRDEVYVVLSGRGTLQIADDSVSLEQGDAAFVPAGVEHRFTGYEGLSVLVVFAGAGEGGTSI